MKIIGQAGKEEVAVVYIADLGNEKLVECVEALEPPLPREEKWVLLVSTMCGCPVGCEMCDAGGFYEGKLSKEEIFAQIDYLIRLRYPDGRVPAKKFKIQFARMGEPALNMAVLDVLEELPQRYDVPGFMPSISTIAPRSADGFFKRLLEVKQKRYSDGRFQFQFSIHTTDEQLRDRIIPVKKWSFAEMAAYGEQFYTSGDRKVTLNFALAQGSPLDAGVLLRHFDPAKFLVKLTPLNPTYKAMSNGLVSHIDPWQEEEGVVVQALRQAGYQVIVSIGEVEENYIGSNCGQYVLSHLRQSQSIRDGYTYPVQAVS
jgi:23S rRNA (adenine2503-C2)-methyltransferase